MVVIEGDMICRHIELYGFSGGHSVCVDAANCLDQAALVLLWEALHNYCIS